jgi:inward rectifier potassium channel
MASPEQHQDVDGDLGFGSVVARQTRQRFLNRDGTFNVRREGLSFWESISPYHYLLSISWPRFLLLAALANVILNTLFACFYVAAGAHALNSFENEPVELRFADAFFFSVQTLGTIGYGQIAPANLAANIIVTIEALVGVIAFAVVAGIVFARFARPAAKIVFSANAVVAPYRDNTTALMFRIANQKNTQLVNLEAKVLLTRRKKDGAVNDREFVGLKLERDSVVFFPLSWTIVHPIDARSPLHGLTEKEFRDSDPEVLVLLNGFDETFSQVVHTRSSYKSDEIVWGARFRTMFLPPEEAGTISVDVRRLHELDRVGLP